MSKFRKLLEKARTQSDYWAESVKLDFAIAINSVMKRKGITKAALAEASGVSPAYITKVLKGDSNFTIESMVKLVHSLGGKLHIHVSSADCNVRWVEVISANRQMEIKPIDNNWAHLFQSANATLIHGESTQRAAA